LGVIAALTFAILILKLRPGDIHQHAAAEFGAEAVYPECRGAVDYFIARIYQQADQQVD